MEVSYQRSPNRSYMILSGEEGEGSYEQEMLRQNAVRLLLSFYLVEYNHELQVWYDITRLRSVRDIVKQEGVTLGNLYMVLSGIATAFPMLSQYLISQQNILLDPDTVYFDREDDSSVHLCYCPLVHDGFQEQMKRFFEFYMDEVDHRKEQITKLVYRLYEMCQDPVTLDELVEVVRREMPDEQRDMPSVEEFRPSEDRVISMRASDDRDYGTGGGSRDFSAGGREIPEEPLDKVPIISKKKTPKKPSIIDRLKAYLAEKFPVLAKLTGKKKAGKKSVTEGDLPEPHDFSNDFVFDPDTELQQKTVFMRKDMAAPSDRHGDENGFEGLLVYDGNNGETDYMIRGGNFRIGSQEGDNEAVLHSKVVSRHHALITRENGDFFLEDLNSTNGTYLNGKLLSYNDRVRLNRMDEIVFADVAYHIV